MKDYHEKTVTNLCVYSVVDGSFVEGTEQCPECKRWFCYGCKINYFSTNGLCAGCEAKLSQLKLQQERQERKDNEKK
jgi:hypothetical protein